MTKICPECGAENDDEQIYCQKCYAKLDPVKTAVWKEEVRTPQKSEDSQGVSPPETVAAPEEPAPEPAQAAEAEPVTEVSKKDAMEALKSAKKAMKDAKAEGKDITAAKNEFMGAKDALDKGDFAAALEIANKTKSLL